MYTGFGPDFPEEMKKLCCVADVIMPNLTEASFLLGIEYKIKYSKSEIEQIAKDLYKLGAKNVLLTGVSFEDDQIGICCYNGNVTDYYFTERLPGSFHGTGDLFASVVAGGLMRGKNLLEAGAIACDTVVNAMKVSMGDDSHWYGVKFEQVLPGLIKRLN